MDLGVGARQTVSAPRIVGIVLVRNEDLLVGRALHNAAASLDEWDLCDHGSTDNTLRIVAEAPSLPAARVRRLRHPRESHDLIRNFAGQDVWIFGLDGDEDLLLCRAGASADAFAWRRVQGRLDGAGQCVACDRHGAGPLDGFRAFGAALPQHDQALQLLGDRCVGRLLRGAVAWRQSAFPSGLR